MCFLCGAFDVLCVSHLLLTCCLNVSVDVTNVPMMFPMCFLCVSFMFPLILCAFHVFPRCFLNVSFDVICVSFVFPLCFLCIPFGIVNVS